MGMDEEKKKKILEKTKKISLSYILPIVVSSAVGGGVSALVASKMGALPTFTVTFENDDGTVLSQEKVKLGAIPTFKYTLPTKPDSTKEEYYDYDFLGWNKAIVAVTCDTTYTATYTSNHQTYVATFYDEDRTTILDQQKINRGVDVEYKGETPTKEDQDGYQFRFKSWTKVGSQESGSINFYANYDSCQAGISISSTGSILSYSGSQKNVVIPDEYGGVKITSIAAGAFAVDEDSNDSLIESITISNNIESIGEGAFQGQTNLKTIVFPNNDNFTTLEDNLFYKCTGLEEVSIPDSIIEIKGSAFSNCTSLTSMSLGKNVKDIDSTFFSECSSLSQITISTENPYYKNDDSKQLIIDISDPEKLVLKQCLPSATSVTIPEDVTKIGDKAFYDCTKITTEINLKNVTEIGSEAFYNCSMTEFDTGFVKKLDTNVFSNCNKLTQITIGESLEEVESDTFSNCSSLSNFRITSHGNSNFKVDNNGILYKQENDQITSLLRCPEGKDSITIPSDETLTTIDKEAFQNCKKITSITIPSNITTIKEYAFHNCRGLTSLVLGENVTSIGANFINGSSVEEITIGKQLVYDGVDPNCLNGCTSLKQIKVDSDNQQLESIDGILFTKPLFSGKRVLIRAPYKYDFTDGNYTVPEETIVIRDYAFSRCDNLESITLHDGIQSIGKYAFGTSSLTKCILNSGNFLLDTSKIDNNAFSNCSNLRNIEFTSLSADVTKNVIKQLYTDLGITILDEGLNIIVNNGSTTISSGLLNNCEYITSIELKEGITTIDDYAFNKCTYLTNITLPDSLTSIGANAFAGCSSLTSLPTMNGVKTIGTYAFYNCTGLTNVVIGNNVETIGQNAFKACSSLLYVELGDSVKTISQAAFSDNTRLLSITLNDGLTTIGNYAFANASSVTTITLPSSLKNITSGGTTTYALGVSMFTGWDKTVTEINYSGTKENFGEIYRKDAFTGSSIVRVICSDGTYDVI